MVGLPEEWQQLLLSAEKEEYSSSYQSGGIPLQAISVKNAPYEPRCLQPGVYENFVMNVRLKQIEIVGHRFLRGDKEWIFKKLDALNLNRVTEFKIVNWQLSSYEIEYLCQCIFPKMPYLERIHLEKVGLEP